MDITAGMVEVTKEEFYGDIYARKLNVHPRSLSDHTEWEYNDGSRRPYGISTQGWKARGAKRFFLAPNA